LLTSGREYPSPCNRSGSPSAVPRWLRLARTIAEAACAWMRWRERSNVDETGEFTFEATRWRDAYEDAPAHRIRQGEGSGGGVNGEPAQRKLVLYMSMSLDGFAARRDGTTASTSWTSPTSWIT
jgi:hypothetical protein